MSPGNKVLAELSNNVYILIMARKAYALLLP